MVTSILLNGSPTWHHDVARMKEKEIFQKSCLLWVFGSKLQNEQQLESYNILSVCYQMITFTFTMTSEMFSGSYLYDVGTHIDFVFMIEP